MINEAYQTPKRRSTLGSLQSEKRCKMLTIQSSTSKNSRPNKQLDSWQHHEIRRENRRSSLLKVRKQKLEEITDQNQKIFIRIKQQQSYYPFANHLQSIQRNKIKENNESQKRFGPIGCWEMPTCFISGSRGIMCDQKLSSQNKTIKNEKRFLPSLGKSDCLQKQNFNEEQPPLKGAKQFLTPNRMRNLSDLYMMI